ncbi:thiamine phosphate synthase [Acidiferrobacter sp.]|uniref:thiamine phosphate synthase n=1 Tax=Acidiferrobacter sp. TaxID=1872107 RepID=UPI002628C767|nr:thiamine phosphate synthase [Acidiferrobacter sp.]
MKIAGLYAITDAACCRPEGLARVRAALSGGARVLQLRCKAPGLTVDAAQTLVAAGHAFGIPVLINDDVELAYAAGADGVHLGRDDATVESARARLGPRAIIGASCYADLDRARDMAARGADYLAFGSFYPSRTKPHAVRAHPSLLSAARPLGRPLVAIGGILPDNGRALIAAGASALAVVDGIFGHSDIEGACRAYQQLFEESV